MEFLRLVTAVIGRPNTRNSHRFGILFPLAGLGTCAVLEHDVEKFII